FADGSFLRRRAQGAGQRPLRDRHANGKGSVSRSDAPQAQNSVEPAAGRLVERDGRSIRVGELAHDRESEARATAAAPRAPEAIERPRAIVGAETGSLVANAQLDVLACDPGEHSDRRAFWRDL